MTTEFKVGDIVTPVRTLSGLTQGKPYEILSISKNSIPFYRVEKDNGTVDGWEECVFTEYPKKWHPHHDLIIEWLYNEDAVVEVLPKGLSDEDWIQCERPWWTVDSDYRITYPDLEKQEQIEALKQQIEALEDELRELSCE